MEKLSYCQNIVSGITVFGYTVKKNLLFLQENAGSCGYQRIPVKNTAAQ